MAKKITLLEIHDYKRLKSVLIEPAEDDHLILIGGNNTEGKSSLLGAITSAMSGGREIPEDPIRHGAKKSSIRVVYDDGDLVVRRKFTKKGTSLEVTNAEGKVSSPQKMLDGLIGKRFVDPMKFSRLSAIEQRKTLLGCVKLDIDLDASAKREKVAFDERRDVNRDAKKIELKLEDFGLASVPEAKDHAELLEALSELQELERQSDDAGNKIGVLNGQVELLETTVAKSQAAFVAARDALKSAKADLEAQAPTIKADVAKLEALEAPDYEAIEAAKAELADCSLHNANVAKLAAERDGRVALEAELAELEGAAEALTDTIERERGDRVDALAAAEMPVEGLTFDDEGLILDGAPFAQASGAQRLRASIAISWALSPELADVWVEDGALLDENSLELVREYAKETGLRVWLERVGEGDVDAIIMRDGMVVDA